MWEIKKIIQRDLREFEDHETLKVNAARHNLLLLLKVNAARHNLLLLLKVNSATHNLLLLLKVNAARHKLTTTVETLVDGKKIIVIEAFVRRDLQLNDEEGTDCLPNATIFEELTRMGTMESTIICLATNQKFNFSKYIFESMVKNLDNAGKFLMYPRKPKRKDTEVPQPSGLITNVADEAVNEEMDDSLVRAATTGSSLEAEQDSDKGLGEEDASKQGRIANIDADVGIDLVSTHFDADTD
ncbi:hypothetical protein Tco_0999679, partial [Tanacetum coccineum]